MEKNYDFKITGTTHDYFAEAVATGNDFLTNQVDTKIKFILRIVSMYFKAGHNAQYIRESDDSFGDITAAIGGNRSRTNESRMVLAHFGIVYSNNSRYKDADGQPVNFDTYDMNDFICKHSEFRQEAFKTVFVDNDLSAREITCDGVDIFLNRTQVFDICVNYILEHIDSVTKYLVRLHHDVSKPVDRELIGIQVNKPTTTNVVYPSQQNISTGTPIDVTKLKRIAMLTNSIANNKFKSAIINNVMTAIIVHKTVEHAQADITNIKESVIKCLVDSSNEDELTADINSISDILVTSL